MIRVLYVDDEPDIREIAEMALSLDPAFEVRTASSGALGVEIARDWRPDVILLDVMMPGMDGPTTLAHLRQMHETAGIPVIFVTARAQPSEMQNFATLDAVGVIAKPFDPMRLARDVLDMIE